MRAHQTGVYNMAGKKMHQTDGGWGETTCTLLQFTKGNRWICDEEKREQGGEREKRK